MVDLPGYGYAKISKKNRLIFRDFVTEYLTERENLLGVIVLIDSRLPPQEIDLDYITWLGESEIAFAIIFTKTDKQSAAANKKRVEAFFEKLGERIEGEPDYFVSSAKTGAGKKEILGYIGENLK